MFSGKQSECSANASYVRLRESMDDPANNITKEYEASSFVSTLSPNLMNRSTYAVRNFVMLNKQVVVIDDIIDNSNAKYDFAFIYDAFIIDTIDVDDKSIVHRVMEARSKLVNIIMSISNIIRDLAKIVGEYVKDPICEVIVTTNGNRIARLPIYSFPFTGMPKDPIVRSSLTYSSLSFRLYPDIGKHCIHLRGATLSGEWSRALIEDFYMPEYNVVSWSGMLVPPSLFKKLSLDS